jgi:hypothetical protein
VAGVAQANGSVRRRFVHPFGEKQHPGATLRTTATEPLSSPRALMTSHHPRTRLGFQDTRVPPSLAHLSAGRDRLVGAAGGLGGHFPSSVLGLTFNAVFAGYGHGLTLLVVVAPGALVFTVLGIGRSSENP